MEEKKRRPRITKPDSGFSLKERPKHYFPGEDQSEKPEGNSENKFRKDTESPSAEERPRTPRDNDKPFERREGGGDTRERKPFERREGGGGDFGERKPFERREGGGDSGERKPYERREGGGGDTGERKPYERREGGGGGGLGERKPYERREGGGGDTGERKPYERREGGGGLGERKPYERREGGGGGSGFGQKRPYGNDRGGFKKPFNKKRDEFHVEKKPKPLLPTGEGMPLNKYLAHCGIASRRKAVDFIAEGLVTVNGEVKKEPYYRVQTTDVVLCDSKPVQIQERMVYVLMNKPKNVITTTDDDHGRATVLDIVDPQFPERLYPVGRLDRDTTGLLLITNDGDLAQRLSHPSYQIVKQYRVGLERPLSVADHNAIEAGLELEDGPITVNWLRFSEDHPTRDVVELEITVGRNRIVRRIFESLGYQVRKLDRFYFAGLTKKDLPRGAFRELTQREIIMLKHFTGHPTSMKIKVVKEFDPNHPDILRLGDEPKKEQTEVKPEAEETPDTNQ